MDDKLQASLNRGAQAEAASKDPFLNECLDNLRTTIVVAWCSSLWPMKEEREALWHTYQSMKLFQSYLVKCVNDGKVAKVDLDRITNLEGP